MTAACAERRLSLISRDSKKSMPRTQIERRRCVEPSFLRVAKRITALINAVPDFIPDWCVHARFGLVSVEALALGRLARRCAQIRHTHAEGKRWRYSRSRFARRSRARARARVGSTTDIAHLFAREKYAIVQAEAGDGV